MSIRRFIGISLTATINKPLPAYLNSPENLREPMGDSNTHKSGSK